MASGRNNSRKQDDSENRRNGRRKQNVDPPRTAPDSERGLTHSPYFNGTFYKRMSEGLHLGGMAKRTHEGHLRAVLQLADFCKRSPDEAWVRAIRAEGGSLYAGLWNSVVFEIV